MIGRVGKRRGEEKKIFYQKNRLIVRRFIMFFFSGQRGRELLIKIIQKKVKRIRKNAKNRLITVLTLKTSIKIIV